MVQPIPPQGLVGLQKTKIILKMPLFLLQKNFQDEQVEDLQTILVPILLIKDHPLKALIHRLQGSRDREITVQDLMINKFIII